MGEILDKMCCIEEQSVDANLYDSNCFLEKTSRTLPMSSISLDVNKQSTVKTLSNLPLEVSTVVMNNYGNPSDNYVTMALLGKGSYGNVMKVMHKTAGVIRAMKVIPKNNKLPGFTEEEIQSEINILKTLKHPNIIKIYETYHDEDSYYLINEYCSEGDLGAKLGQAKYFNECIVKVLMFQIFSAVQYLHSKNILHGDLKLENVMIDSVLPLSVFPRRTSFISSVREDEESIKRAETLPNAFFFNASPKFKFEKMKNYDLKLIDFGCSKMFSSNTKNEFGDTIGTLLYCSPEVLNNQYDEKCDVWSCGVIMYLLLSGRYPFDGQTEDQITTSILNKKFDFKPKMFELVSYQAKDLIKKCLTFDHQQRISVKDALNHLFFRNDIDPLNLYQESINTKEVLMSLTHISNSSKFYQTVLVFLAHNFARKDEIGKLKTVFRSIDLNGDGMISKEELSFAYKSAGIELNNQDLDKIIKAIDFDHNGMIDYEEFIRISLPQESLFTEVNLKTAFDMFDTDKNGTISQSEIKSALGMDANVDDSVIKELLLEIQNTGDEEITYDQFKHILLNNF